MRIKIKFISLTGPRRRASALHFGTGLNVIYGASDSGKSFVLDAINYALGSGEALRELEESKGYEYVHLGFMSSHGDTYTIVRGIGSEKIHVFYGIVENWSFPEPLYTLKRKHDADKSDNLSMFLLGLLEMQNVQVRKNRKGETRSLSFRNLIPFTVVPETEIQRRGSPFLSGQYTDKTVEERIFNYLLTGRDDRSVGVSKRRVQDVTGLNVRIKVVEEILRRQREELDKSELGGTAADELREALAAVDRRIEEYELLRADKEERYWETLQRRRTQKRHRDSLRDNVDELREVKERFDILDQHYESDVSRLEAIAEAGSLLAALDQERCPVCGARQEHHDPDLACEGDVETVARSAEAELNKIIRLRSELYETYQRIANDITRIETEIDGVDRTIMELFEEENAVKNEIGSFKSNLASMFEKRSNLEWCIRLCERINEYQEELDELYRTKEDLEEVVETSRDVSGSGLDKLMREMGDTLERWGFPGPTEITFDEKQKDFVLGNDLRSNRGKGVRALTYAAFTIGLMENAYKEGLPHPGFVVLDTPLLAYREPEEGDKDIRRSGVKDRFFYDLHKNVEGQVIIIENENPPASLEEADIVTYFTRNPNAGRPGFLM